MPWSIRYNVQTFISSVKGTLMIDPLSLNDFPEIELGKNFKVDVIIKNTNESQTYGTKTSQSEKK